MAEIRKMRFSEEFWSLFYSMMNQMIWEGLLPEYPDRESADLFFTQLAAKMIEMSEGDMPPLDETIWIVREIMQNEIGDIQSVLRELEKNNGN